MVAAKRDKQYPGVAYSHGRNEVEEFKVIKNDVYSLNTKVTNTKANLAADSAFQQYSKALQDIVSPNESKLSVFEAFSKLDLSSTLETRTLVAVRILTNEEHTRGLRVLAFGLGKDQWYGSKVGYKKVQLNLFDLKDEEITRVFAAVTQQQGLDVSFYENSKALVMRAHDPGSGNCHQCQTMTEYCVSKTNNPVFRRESATDERSSCKVTKSSRACDEVV